jgi:translation initiation factor IF-3
VNEQIRATRVRLIGTDGSQVGVISLEDARRAAQDAELDLVQVSPDADPPVCKLMDYGKYRYKQKRKLHQARTKSHATHIKEIRLHPKTSQHDIDYRLEHARQFLSRGDKVLISVVFSGREMAHVEVGGELLEKVAAQMEADAKIEMAPKREGRRFTMMLAPK